MAIVQRYEPAFPLADLVEHPDNPRRGNLDLLDDSIGTHGFYGAVLVQTSTNRIIAGNHRSRAARRRGADTVPVLLLDVDDDTAARILLVDNRSNDVATYDETLLTDLLASFDGDLHGTGFGDDDLTALLAALDVEIPDEFGVVDEDRPTEYRCPSCGYEWNGQPSP